MEQKKKSNQKGLTIVVAAATWVLCLISAVGLFTVRDSQIGLWRDLSAMMGGFAPIVPCLLFCLFYIWFLPHLVSCGSLSWSPNC